MAKIETILTDAQVRIAEALFGGSYGVRIGKRSGDPVHVPVPVAEMPEAAIVKMFAYGVQRTFNDAVGGADTDTEAKAAKVREMVADYREGNIGRRAAEGVDPLTAAIRAIIRPLVKEAMKAEDWEALADDAAELGKALDQVFADQDDATQARITESAKAKLAAAEAARKAKAGLSVTVKL